MEYQKIHLIVFYPNLIVNQKTKNRWHGFTWVGHDLMLPKT